MREEGPACPFCHAPWSEAMLARLDAATGPAGCACCVSRVEASAEHPRPLPDEDIACEHCGRVLFTAPALR